MRNSKIRNKEVRDTDIRVYHPLLGGAAGVYLKGVLEKGWAWE